MNKAIDISCFILVFMWNFALNWFSIYLFDSREVVYAQQSEQDIIVKCLNDYKSSE
jgi:hypothetical protein